MQVGTAGNYPSLTEQPTGSLGSLCSLPSSLLLSAWRPSPFPRGISWDLLSGGGYLTLSSLTQPLSHCSIGLTSWGWGIVTIKIDHQFSEASGGGEEWVQLSLYVFYE